MYGSVLHFYGAAEGTRTPDPIITNDVLYQLSYSGPLLRPYSIASKTAKGLFWGFLSVNLFNDLSVCNFTICIVVLVVRMIFNRTDDQGQHFYPG